MISIKRGECPALISGSPTNGDYYNRSEVVGSLRRMQHGKCCYCECEVPRIGQGKHVEHFRPKEKTEFHTLRNHWPNLLLACPQCNGQKGDQFPTRRGQAVLIDPSSPRIDPEEHIGFVADANADSYEPIGLPVPKSVRGRKTVEVIGLWLPDQVRARRKYYETSVLPLYVQMTKAKAENEKSELRRAISELEALMKSRNEFAGFVRSFAINMELDKSFGVKIPVGS